MPPLSRTYCVIPLYSSTTPTSSTTTFSARFVHSTSSAHTSRLQPHIQTRKIHRLAVHSRTNLYPQTILLPSTRKSRISPAARSSQSPTPALSPRTLFSTTRFTMSSDDAYMSFLDKANADLNAGRAQQQGASETARTETVDANTKIPASLQSVDAYYVSDADEPFEPVALRWDGASKGVWPSAEQFSRLISPSADLSQAISTLSPSSFDPKNQYTSVLRAVRSAAVEKASDGDQSGVEVKIYRVELTSTKLEYWVLALDVPEARVVGLRAKAFES